MIIVPGYLILTSMFIFKLIKAVGISVLKNIGGEKFDDVHWAVLFSSNLASSYLWTLVLKLFYYMLTKWNQLLLQKFQKSLWPTRIGSSVVNHQFIETRGLPLLPSVSPIHLIS